MLTVGVLLEVRLGGADGLDEGTLLGLILCRMLGVRLGGELGF